MNIIFTDPALGKGDFRDTRPCQLRVACPDLLPTNFLIAYDYSLQALDQTNFFFPSFFSFFIVYVYMEPYGLYIGSQGEIDLS